jgi:hypothetical protein
LLSCKDIQAVINEVYPPAYIGERVAVSIEERLAAVARQHVLDVEWNWPKR